MPRLIIYSIYLIWSCIGVLELHQLFGVWSGFRGQIHSTPIQQDHCARFGKIMEIALALDGATAPVAKLRMKDSDHSLAEKIMYYYITK